MTKAVTHAGQVFLDRYAGLRGRLPGDRTARDAAAESFRAAGLPSTRDEAWRYTNLRAVADLTFEEPLTSVDGPAPDLPDIDAPRLVFLDGRFQPSLSTAERALSGPSPAFGRQARPAEHPMVALNTMFADDGAVLEVPAGVDAGTIVLASATTDPHRTAAFHPRHRIALGAGARLSVIQVSAGQGIYLHNEVAEISVAEDAVMTHISLQDDSGSAFHVATRYVDVAERGTYDAFALNVGARLSRTEIHARLHGPHGMAHLNGAQLLGASQLGDITTVVRHEAPNCGSRQTVKNVLTDRARGVFQGKIEVARVAQKTDGYQMSQALLLSPEAEIDCKPQLEIYADDVKCSHGATVGELDAEQLFYLRSRGVPDQEARALLIRAFLDAAMEGVVHDDARALLERAIERWWERRA